MKKPFLYLALAGCALLCACNNKYDCYTPYLTYSFVGFDTSELRTILVKRYKRDGGFRELRTTLVGSYLQPDNARNDTLSLVRLTVDPAYDDEVILPGAGNRTFRISQVTYGDEQYKKDGFLSEVDIDCTESWSLNVDGKVLTCAKTPAYHERGSFPIQLVK